MLPEWQIKLPIKPTLSVLTRIFIKTRCQYIAYIRHSISAHKMIHCVKELLLILIVILFFLVIYGEKIITVIVDFLLTNAQNNVKLIVSFRSNHRDVNLGLLFVPLRSISQYSICEEQLSNYIDNDTILCI